MIAEILIFLNVMHQFLSAASQMRPCQFTIIILKII